MLIVSTLTDKKCLQSFDKKLTFLKYYLQNRKNLFGMCVIKRVSVSQFQIR